ncbi:hypothetical protein GCM10027290_64900 [Micromonospora sonneratiae]|uniref:Immunity 51 family protein n=1 Tax=Micromonospora sonneratiae TaxID=1184706 RepID=A0ABW3YNS3_9ACTN
MTDGTTLTPLKLFEYDHAPGNYCLLLSDNDMVDTAAVFEEHGYEGGGYAWAGVARSAVATHAPELADRVRYDPEAGMFVAYGTDAAALEQLGGLLHQAFHDRDALAALIRAGEPDWFD